MQCIWGGPVTKKPCLIKAMKCKFIDNEQPKQGLQMYEFLALNIKESPDICDVSL
jgi:hypothetical protein